MIMMNNDIHKALKFINGWLIFLHFLSNVIQQAKPIVGNNTSHKLETLRGSGITRKNNSK